MRKQALVFMLLSHFSLFLFLSLVPLCLANEDDPYAGFFNQGEPLPPKSKENAKTMYAGKSETYFYGLRITNGEDGPMGTEQTLRLGGKEESFLGSESPRIYRNIANGNVIVLIEDGYKSNILAFHGKGKTWVAVIENQFSSWQVLSVEGVQYLLYPAGLLSNIVPDSSMATQADCWRVAVFDGTSFVPGKIGEHREVYKKLMDYVVKRAAGDRDNEAWGFVNPAQEVAFYMVMLGKDPKRVTQELAETFPQKYKSHVKPAMANILKIAHEKKLPVYGAMEN